MRSIAAGLGRRKSSLRARIMYALTTPLVFMTRTGDEVGVRLVRSSL